MSWQDLVVGKVSTTDEKTDTLSLARFQPATDHGVIPKECSSEGIGRRRMLEPSSQYLLHYGYWAALFKISKQVIRNESRI